MNEPLQVLIIEDSEDDAALVVHELKHGGYDPIYERVDTREAMNTALDQKAWDVVISDYTMPHFKGTEALELMKQKAFDLPFIIVSGTIGEETAVAAMKSGAHDYIMKGNLTRLVAAVEREIKEAKVRQDHRQAEETIKYLAYHDVLTGLANRTSFRDRLLELIQTSRLENSSFALLIMDIDQFKEVNNTLGHHNGDLLLKEIGKRLRDTIQEAHTIARLEGNKFALLLSDTDAGGVAQGAGKIIRRLEEPFSLEGLSFELSAGIGVALFPGHGEEADTLLRLADMMIYVARQRGDSYVIYSPQYDQYSPSRLALLGELRHAIECDQLFLLYQPKIDLKTGQAIGAEALVRWKHPKLGGAYT